jgi:hypothetical protein
MEITRNEIYGGGIMARRTMFFTLLGTVLALALVAIGGALLEQVVEVGANQIQGISFTVSDPSTVPYSTCGTASAMSLASGRSRYCAGTTLTPS